MTESERAERVHYHEYVTCEGIREHAERIVALEELVLDVFEDCVDECDRWRYADRMRELGIEVD